jgi:hypothetical protein
MTKTGYYAPESLTAADLVPQRVNPMDEISEAAQSSVTFDSIGLSIVHVVRHPDHNTADVTVLLKSTHLRWQATNDGRSGANVTVAAVSLSGRRDIMASQVREARRAIQQSGCRAASAIQHISNGHGANAAAHGHGPGGDPGG